MSGIINSAQESLYWKVSTFAVSVFGYKSEMDLANPPEILDVYNDPPLPLEGS